MPDAAQSANTPVAASAAVPPPVIAGRTPIEEANVATVLRMFSEGWGANPGWEDVWRANVAPDVRTHFHSHPPMDGLEAAIEFNRELFEGFPTLRMSVEDVTAEGDTVIVRGHLTGTQDGPFLDAPASGAPVDVPDVTMFRLKDRRIVENRYSTDLFAVMVAIGAVEMKG